MIGVIIEQNESIDRALRRFKKKYERAGVVKEFRKRMAYLKPSVEKKQKLGRSIRREQFSKLDDNS